ncbi:MAG: histidine kinase [Opitutae bacterium]|nr:histidine kinase [Opitutae bacterium]
MRPRFALPTLLAFALALVSAAGGRAEPDRERGLPLVRNFPPRVNGGLNQIWDGAVAPDGTVLFGNFDRVLEFDGQTWRQIAVPSGAYVRGLGVDAAGTVWVAGVNELGRIERGADGRRTFHSLRALVPKEAGDLGTLWQVHVTDQGIWFQGNTALLRWRDGKFDYWLTGERGIVLSFWLGDHLLVALTRGWMKPVEGGKWEELGDPADKLGNYFPHFAVPHPRGGWLMGLEGEHGVVAGLGRWDGRKLTLEPHPLDELFKSKRLYSGVRLGDGRYALGLLQGGAVLLDAQLNFQAWLNEDTGLESSTATSLTPDDQRDVLWVGSEWGVARAEVHPAYTWFGAANGLRRHASSAAFRWHGRLLASGAQGLNRLEPAAVPGGITRFARWSPIDDKIWAFKPAGDTLLVGALGGLWEIDAQGTARKIKSVTNIFAIAVTRASSDIAYTATLRGLYRWERHGAEWQQIGGTRDVRGNSIVEDRDGALWLGTDNQGVWRVEFPSGPGGGEPRAVNYGREAGLPVGEGGIGVAEVAGAPLFITPRGLYRFDAETKRFRAETAFGKAFTDGTLTARAIAQDGRGDFWVLAMPGGPIDPAAALQLGCVRDGVFIPVPLPDMQRLAGKASLYLDRVDGREVLWVLGQAEYLRIDLQEWRQRAPAPLGPTTLREIGLGDGRRAPLASDGPLQIGPGSATVRFRFAAPGLAGETDARYETRLVGFGDGATEVEARGERVFTNLPPGRYVFEARGRTGDGRWTVPVSVPLVVLAPWWQTLWAVAVYLVLGSLALFAYIRWRIRRLLRERTRLEDVIAQRTAELARKNAELERLHRLDQDEKLAARLAEEKAQLELLRYQLNPHFLYNSLNSIRALVYANAEAAGEMVTRLSEFCRWTLTRGGDGMTTVAEEVEMLHAYLDIERARWQEGLLTRVYVAPEARTVPVPQFLFLPLIENAIKYGGRTSPNVLEVAVTLKVEGEILVCEIANTGAWIGEKFTAPSAMNGDSTHIGLENLRRRLSRYYGPACRPHIVTEDGWVRVRLRLPMKPRVGSNPPV